MAHPSMPATARVGPVVGVELPRDPRGALTFRNGRETVRGRHAIFTAARDPKPTLRSSFSIKVIRTTIF